MAATPPVIPADREFLERVTREAQRWRAARRARRFRFSHRFTSTDGIDFYMWTRPIPNSSHEEQITAPVAWLWAGNSTHWKGTA